MSRAEDCDPRPHMHVGVCQRAGYANGLADAAGRTVSGEREAVAAVEALIRDWASASTERATITRWAAASRLRKALAATAPAHDEAAAAMERVRVLTTDPDGTPHEHGCLSPDGHGYGCHACWAESINAALAPTAAEQATGDLDSHDDPPRRPLGPREPGGES